MLFQIKNRIENELSALVRDMETEYRLPAMSSPLYREIGRYALRKGKRLRPVLLVASYLGFSKKPAKGLYRTAVSLELLHDFLLVHDDIIDKSETRRGKPSLHRRFEGLLSGRKNVKFDGQDMAIIAGDVLYAIAMRAFLSIREKPSRKEGALAVFLDAGVKTSSGEFAELLFGFRDIVKTDKARIYEIYDLKTAHYSFVAPLLCGAILGGAPGKDIERLRLAGIYLGRAFQIKDDILGIFGNEKITGKSSLDDLREGKKTILIWHAYNHSNGRQKRYLKKLLTVGKAARKDLVKVRDIMISGGSLKHARKLASSFHKKARGLVTSSDMRPAYRDLLLSYLKDLLG